LASRGDEERGGTGKTEVGWGVGDREEWGRRKRRGRGKRGMRCSTCRNNYP